MTLSDGARCALFAVALPFVLGLWIVSGLLRLCAAALLAIAEGIS